MTCIVLFNKPYDVLSQFTDGGGRATLADFIEHKSVYPAGRLDRESEGLLVLTDDNALATRITQPQQKMGKTYFAQVEGAPEDRDLKPLREGITLKDGRCRPLRCRLIEAPDLWPRTPPIRVRRAIPDRWLELTLTEGRNRQVRRMCAAIGFPVLRLIRYRVGSWTYDGLAPGQHRVIDLAGRRQE